jgi:hypothetical protein
MAGGLSDRGPMTNVLDLNLPVGQRLPGSRQPVAAFQGDGTRSGGGGARERGARPTGLRKRGEPLQDPGDTASRAALA